MSERPIVYPLEGVADTDLLRGWKADMIGLGWLAQALLGTTTLCSGLGCTPGTGLSVSVAAGAIFAQETTDATGYGSLGTDSHLVVKQGLVLDPTVLNVTAPVTSGQSINYLVEATYTDTDVGSTLLPYYNATNPTQPYSGPANDGINQMTIRRGVCTLAIKAGAAAATGMQVTPSPDANNVGLWVVTVAYGATTISSGNISAYSPSSMISETLTQKISQATADARYTQPATRAQAAAGTSTTLAITPDDLLYVLSLLGLGSTPGDVKWSACTTVPNGWLECNGSAVSRTAYASLYSAIGVTYGSGDGSTTFNLPDLRGEFVRGWDHGRGVDSGRAFGSTQTDQMQGHLHQLPNVPEQGTGYGYTGTSGVNNTPINSTGDPVTDGTNGTPRYGTETRPVNVAMLPLIKT